MPRQTIFERQLKDTKKTITFVNSKQIMRLSHYLYIACVALVSVACSTTKYVPDGSFLLDKVEVKADGDYRDVDMNAMKSFVRQKPNSSWFSSWRVGLQAYSLAGRDTTKWMNRTLRAIGEAPVIYDQRLTDRSVVDLREALHNQGYLNAHVDVDTITKGKKLLARYTLYPGRQHYINSVHYDVRDSVIAAMPTIADSKHRGLHPGQSLTIDRLNNERKRLTTLLTDYGYYRFNKDFISFEADTVEGMYGVDLRLILHPYGTSSISDTLHTQYTIDTVRFVNSDTTADGMFLRESVLKSNTFLVPGRTYSAADLQRTYNHFGRLGAVRYTNIGFREHPGEPKLDCDIMLSAASPNTITFQPEGTNTAGDLGVAASLMYQNRNLFRGSELFSFEVRGAFEAIRGLEGYNNSNFEEYTVETGITFPRFIVPFLSKSFRRRTIATSEVSVMYNLQNRPEYHRRVLSAAWRYKWNDPAHHDRYNIDLLEISYVSMPWISDKFRTDYLEDVSSRNVILRYNYEDLFIMKTGVGFTYNNGRYAIRASAETAGNLLSLGTEIFGARRNELGQKKVFRIAYAQYAKADFSYTNNINLGDKRSLVFNANFGIAYPYGNSTVLPFEKRYFSGGANSVRGWSVRELGPGRYRSNGGGIDFINQTGDVKLTMNLEYRSHLFWKLDGAVFVDAGNIWTLRSYDDQPDGQFKIGEFWKQLAAAYGLGLRFNFDYFILRFDFGMKAIDPAYTDARQFPIKSPKLSRDMTFHFAVGLPF